MKGIVFDTVSFQYSQNSKEINAVNVAIPRGSFCGITGVNGSGKTTLSLMMNGLIPHHISGKMLGNVFIDEVNTRSKSVSFFSKKVRILIS